MKTRTNHYRSIFILFLFFAFFFTPAGSGFAEETPAAKTNSQPSTQSTLNHSHPIFYMLDFYKKFVSEVDGDRCQMYPSCSTYSREAFQKHGLFIGWIMSCDRLVRCGRDEVKLAPQVWVNGQKRSYDPLTNNDFRW